MKQDDFISCQMFMVDYDGRKWDSKKNAYTGIDISFDEIKKRADDNGISGINTCSCITLDIIKRLRN